jgi:hypothetical protein
MNYKKSESYYINKIALAIKLKSLGIDDRSVVTESKLNWNSYKKLLLAIK